MSQRSVWVRRQRDWPRQCRWPGCISEKKRWDVPLCTDHAISVFGIIQHDFARLTQNRTAPERVRGEGRVYFLRFGNRIKIGFTTNLPQRLADLPHDEVLGTMPGTMREEKQCHALFAHLRETGEWFRAEPELLAFIADVAA